MHSVYALVCFELLHPLAYVFLQMNHLPIYGGESSLSSIPQSCTCPVITPLSAQSLTVNSKTFLTVNQTKFLLWVFEFNQACTLLVLQNSMQYNICTLLLFRGYSTSPRLISLSTNISSRTPHLRFTERNSFKICDRNNGFLAYTPTALVWSIE